MDKLKIALISLSIAILYVASIAGIVLYYNGVVATQDFEINHLQAQNTNLTSQNNALNQQLNQQISEYMGASQVKISSLDYDPGFNPYGSLTIEKQIMVSVKNQGNSSVNGLKFTLVVSLHWVNGELLSDSKNYTTQFIGIQAGETKTFQGNIYYQLRNLDLTNNTMLVGQLWLGNVLLDDKNQTINLVL